MKVVINKCFGGFGLSTRGMKRYMELGGKSEYEHSIERTEPALIQVVEELGKKANGDYAKLAVIEIPDGTPYHIEYYDGVEWITDERYRWE